MMRIVNTHHSNYNLILQLRSESRSLDEQIKSTLLDLATVRKSLRAIPIPAPSQASTFAKQSINVEEILAYAKFISKTSSNPRRPLPIHHGNSQVEKENEKEAVTTEDIKVEGQDYVMVNTDEATVLNDGGKSKPDDENNEGEDGGKAGKDNGQSEALRNLLPPEIKNQFVPWPSYEIITGGGLADVQKMKETGEDPYTVTTTRTATDDNNDNNNNGHGGDGKVEVINQEQEQKEQRRGIDVGPTRHDHGDRDDKGDEFDPDEM